MSEAITVTRVAEAGPGGQAARRRDRARAFVRDGLYRPFADDDRLYARNGWARVTNRCSWVKIHDHVTVGLARQEDPGVMMVKALGEQPWPDGDADLLGHLF